MADLGSELSDKLKELGANWAVYSALGSFALYLLGYLSLRFHLTVLGVGTDLAVLDERYLFAGTRFLVYVVSSVPLKHDGLMSLEKKEWNHGAFTKALIEGLSGKADGIGERRDGVIYVHELGSWVIERVKELTRGEQHVIYAQPPDLPSFPLFVLK